MPTPAEDLTALQASINAINWDNNAKSVDGPITKSIYDDILALMGRILDLIANPASIGAATTSQRGIIQLAELATADSDAEKAVTMVVLIDRIQDAIASIPGGSSVSSEQIVDAIAGALPSTGSIDIVYDDLGNQIQITVKNAYVDGRVDSYINSTLFQNALNALVATQVSTAFSNPANQEIIRDLVQGMFQDSATVTWNISDSNNTISADASGSGGGTSNHNALSNLQGGQDSEYYHLTQVEYDAIQEIVDPFQAATLSLNTFTLQEKGVSFIPVLSGSIVLNDALLTQRRLLKNGTAISGQTGTGLTISYTDTAAVDTVTYALEATFSNAPTQTLTRVCQFVAPTYYGVGGATPNEAFVEGLTKLLATAGNREDTVFSPVGQRFIFAEPASYGIRERILDPNGYRVESGFTRTQVTYTLANGSTELYNLYVSNNNTTQSNYLLRFYFS